MIVNKPKIASEMFYYGKHWFAHHDAAVLISRLWKENILTESDKRMQELEFMSTKWT